MSSFNWIAVVAKCTLGVCVLLIACLESVTSRKLSQDAQH